MILNATTVKTLHIDDACHLLLELLLQGGPPNLLTPSGMRKYQAEDHQVAKQSLVHVHKYDYQ